MNKTTIAAAICLAVTAGSANAAGPLAKIRAAMPTLPALPNLAAAKPVGVRVAGINVVGTQGKGLLAGLGVAAGSNVGHGIVGAGLMSGANSGTGLVGVGVLSGIGSGTGPVSIGIANAGQTPLHLGILGKNIVGH